MDSNKVTRIVTFVYVNLIVTLFVYAYIYINHVDHLDPTSRNPKFDETKNVCLAPLLIKTLIRKENIMTFLVSQVIKFAVQN